MHIDHTLTIHAPLTRVWPLLQRPEVVVESLPGVTLTSLDDEEFTGKMSVGLGPMRLNYGGRGTLRYDEPAHAIHIDARGSEARGAGSAAAVVDVTATEGADESTRLVVSIELDLQGKPAQFGRGILSEVVTRLATQFGKNLERQVLSGAVETPTPTPTPDRAQSDPTPAVAPLPRPSPTGLPTRVPPIGRQVIGIIAGGIVGAAAASLFGSRRAPALHLTIIGADEKWLELAREIARARH